MRAHDELPRAAAGRAKQAAVQRAADAGAEPELLRLQRSSGNEAVAQLVQRDRAASTDAPGAKKKQAPPKKSQPKWIPGRLLAYAIKDGRTYITIGLGSNQGVKPGMHGRLLRSSGTQIVTFEVDSVNGATHAYVEASIDEVKDASVEIDVGTQPESQEGKEF